MTDLVMHDTLERAASAPYHAGYFAVTVGAVRRSPDQPGWGEHLLAASLEFTQVLGGLRHQEGDPLFALRFITRPDPRLPERQPHHRLAGACLRARRSCLSRAGAGPLEHAARHPRWPTGSFTASSPSWTRPP